MLGADITSAAGVSHRPLLFWAYPFSVYWWNLSYYKDPVPIDYVFYWGGFLAIALRIAAWSKKRHQVALRNGPGNSPLLVLKGLGVVLVVFGLLVAATGRKWQEPVTEFSLTPEWSANLVLWLRYWPFEPYLSLFIIGSGALLMTKTRA